jgi:hypothetical protein
MQRILTFLAALSLACASSAAADPATAPQSPPPPAANACRPSGKVVFEIDHRANEGAKAETSMLKVYGPGAWTREAADAEGKPQAATSGCLDKAYAKHLASSLRSAPWKVTTARMHCMAVSATFTEYQVDGKVVFTQRLCSGQSLDAKSQAVLDDAVAHVEAAAKSS